LSDTSSIIEAPSAVAASPDQPEESPQLLDEQVGLLEGCEVPAAVGLVPVADVEEAISAQRRDGRWISLGKIEQPVGTATVSPVGPEIHSFTCLLLSQ